MNILNCKICNLSFRSRGISPEWATPHSREILRGVYTERSECAQDDKNMLIHFPSNRSLDLPVGLAPADGLAFIAVFLAARQHKFQFDFTFAIIYSNRH